MKGRTRRATLGHSGAFASSYAGLVLPVALMVFQMGALVQPARAEQPWTIPALQEWTDRAGSYTFGPGSRIVVDPASSSQISTTAFTFGGELAVLTGVTVPVVTGISPQAGDMSLTLGAADSTIGEEGYLLTVADHITISAQADAGVFYLSRPNRKFRFEPSRKFLLTTARLKDGTNRDEPRGTR